MTWVPIRSGRSYRVDSPACNALVTPELARELERVLEKFGSRARRRRNTEIRIFFKPGIFGHHKVGRAVDIYGVDGLGLDEWKKRWDRVWRCLGAIDEVSKREFLDQERQQNLGWQLYKTLQTCGRWCQPHGYPIQLFGPWTRREGPWKKISDFLLNAHRDHIHVAK